MTDVDAGQRTQILRYVHIEDVGAAAFEVARVEPYLAARLIPVLPAVESDVDPGRCRCSFDVAGRHVDDVGCACQ